jgi:hypothetical protein
LDFLEHGENLLEKAIREIAFVVKGLKSYPSSFVGTFSYLTVRTDM